MQTTTHRPHDVVRELGPVFARRAADHDDSDAFVTENYRQLREARLFSAMVPKELGGGGCSHHEMCLIVRDLAEHCSSTGLAFSMHQHLIAAALFNHRQGRPGEALLRRVVEGEAVLVSTGASDWLASSGSTVRCEGGIRVTAKKPFASGSPGGHMLVTSAPYEDPDEGWQVLHFAVPLSSDGVDIQENWRAMGMRGTGSNTVVLTDVFVPEEAVVLRRPRGAYHGVWNVVLTVAMPLICAAYVGVARSAARLVREQAAARGDDGIRSLLVGEMETELATAEVAHESMMTLARDLDFTPTVELADDILKRKTIVTQAVMRTTDKALEATGGGGYFRAVGLERLVRDARAGQFHPLQPKLQHRFTGRLAMGLDPIAEPA